MRSSATIGGESEPSTCRRSFSVWCATRTITRSGACRPTFPWYGSRGEDDRCLLHPTGTGHFTLRSPQRSGAKAKVSRFGGAARLGPTRALGVGAARVSAAEPRHRKSLVEGTSVSVGVVLGGSRIL